MIVVAQVSNNGSGTGLSAVGGERELGSGCIWNRWSVREKSIMSSIRSKALGLRNWEKGVAPIQDREARGRSWFGEDGVIWNKLSLRFLSNVEVETTESEHWSLE